MKQKGSDKTGSKWGNLWGNAKNYESTGKKDIEKGNYKFLENSVSKTSRQSLSLIALYYTLCCYEYFIQYLVYATLIKLVHF